MLPAPHPQTRLAAAPRGRARGEYIAGARPSLLGRAEPPAWVRPAVRAMQDALPGNGAGCGSRQQRARPEGVPLHHPRRLRWSPSWRLLASRSHPWLYCNIKTPAADSSTLNALREDFSLPTCYCRDSTCSEKREARRNTTMSEQWFEVQWHLGRVQVARQSGSWRQPPPGYVLVSMAACGICGADIRVITGNKAASGDPNRYVTLGHEGSGRVVAVGDAVTCLRPGDYVAVLPHTHLPAENDEGVRCSARQIDPVCIGASHTRHMGWDIDGCFADFITVPATNLVPVSPEHLRLARALAPRLGEAVFALVEPMLCSLSAYELMQRQLRKFFRRDLSAGRALVVGCGPIGLLHSAILLARGFEVWLADALPRRAELACWYLDHRARVFDPEDAAAGFDLAMITASSAQAVRMGEALVRDEGIVYVFSGLNAAERDAMDSENLFLYERLHRTTKPILTAARLPSGDKSIVYLGHSGYFEGLAPEAVAAVAANAVALDRMITGIISGWSSPCIESRLPGGTDWTTEDGSPAIISVLDGTDLRARHCKLLVLAGRG
ncbi:MAG: alcohol dehydrogenase catalytic domain-containing protein [Ktedonobacteraceae bacterium]